jgi:hypothetical protein
MDQVLSRVQMKDVYSKVYWELVELGIGGAKFPLNVGISKMNKKQLAEHINLMHDLRIKLQAEQA